MDDNYLTTDWSWEEVVSNYSTKETYPTTRTSQKDAESNDAKRDSVESKPPGSPSASVLNTSKTDALPLKAKSISIEELPTECENHEEGVAYREEQKNGSSVAQDLMTCTKEHELHEVRSPTKQYVLEQQF
jgi:hypothetical protein